MSFLDGRLVFDYNLIISLGCFRWATTLTTTQEAQVAVAYRFNIPRLYRVGNNIAYIFVACILFLFPLMYGK